MASDSGQQPDPKQTRPPQADPEQNEGLVQTGPADIVGVQDLGPADAEAESEGAPSFGEREELRRPPA
jgi:hypothetical protein